MIHQVEVSGDLQSWSSAPEDVVLVSSVNIGGGVALVTYRSTTSIGDFSRQFVRLRVSLR